MEVSSVFVYTPAGEISSVSVEFSLSNVSLSGSTLRQTHRTEFRVSSVFVYTPAGEISSVSVEFSLSNVSLSGSTLRQTHRTEFRLCEWAKGHVTGVQVTFVPQEQVEENHPLLNARYDDALAITGSREAHHFVPDTPGKIKVSFTRHSTEFRVVTVLKGAVVQEGPAQLRW
ncbi:UNVERIFIED_CONTAM: hypothetical protein FKN15_051436 [Acipenser sinensis]